MQSIRPSRVAKIIHLQQPKQTPVDTSPCKDLLKAASIECQNLAVLTLVTASVLNDLDARFQGHIPQHAAKYMPAAPVVVPHLFSENRGHTCSFASVAVAAAMIDDLAQAKRLLRSACSGQQLRHRIGTIAMDEIVHAWRAVAGRVLLTIFELERIGDYFESIGDSRSLRHLAKLLVEARNGATPCSLNGEPVFPQGVQRRRNRRISLNACGSVRCRAGAFPILATDISTCGMGLDHATRLAIGEIVSVTIESGRRFIGVVVWQSGNRAGLKFGTELVADDPILSGG